MKSNILITGADGFIGSHLIELLIQTGYKVRAFVYYNSFNSNAICKAGDCLKSSISALNAKPIHAIMGFLPCFFSQLIAVLINGL